MALHIYLSFVTTLRKLVQQGIDFVDGLVHVLFELLAFKVVADHIHQTAAREKARIRAIISAGIFFIYVTSH